MLAGYSDADSKRHFLMTMTLCKIHKQADGKFFTNDVVKFKDCAPKIKYKGEVIHQGCI